MLTKVMMQEIQDLKLQGYTPGEIPDFYLAQGIKPPSMPTIRKYYSMDVVPESPGERLEKPKAFDSEPFRAYIIEVLRNNENNSRFTVSSLYDMLEERFTDTGEFESLPGNQQTLRNYVAYLREKGIIAREPKNTRIYDHVFETAPGEQMLIDFGEIKATGVRIHFICLLMRYSRHLFVYAQDHKFNSVEACAAIYRSFCRMGGRPQVLVIDQDSVFVASESYGEVIKTQVFEDFCAEQELKLWTCRKADPESKGPIENSVGFVKKNFFAARRIESIEDVWRKLPDWLKRKNKRVHQSTFCVPEQVFNEIEKPALRPLLPSFYEDSPNSFRSCDLNGYPFIKYRSNKYSVPKECCFHKVFFKIVGSKLHVYDESMNFVCTHMLCEGRGRTIQLDEHKHKPSDKWLSIAERMRAQWNCVDFQNFVNGVKTENPRYRVEQFTQIENFLNEKNADRATVAVLIKQCCKSQRYHFSQIKQIYEDVVSGKVADNGYAATDVQTQDLSIYQLAFERRCEVL